MTGRGFVSGGAVGRGVQRLVAFVLRAVMAAAGLVFMLMLMVFGLVAGSLLVIWALLRGRRPGHARGEVIDIEAREVVPPAVGPREGH